jgi:hypothetical protein
MRGVFIFLAVVPPTLAGREDLLICHTDPGATSDVETYIADSPFYDIVTLLDCTTTTPSVDTMEDYGGVFTWSNYAYDDPVAFGNNLADYMDYGGVVVSCSFSHYYTDGWGIGGRYASDPDYCPLTRGWNEFHTTSLGSHDDSNPIMYDVESITHIYYWQSVSTESTATWVADLADGTDMVAVNCYYSAVAINLYPGDYRYWTGDGWTLYNNALMCLGVGFYDIWPPYVEDMDPDDGETDVPVDSTIVFHCKDQLWGVDVSTIDFTVRDTTLSGVHVVSAGAALSVPTSPVRTLPGDLDIDDADPLDVVCTWTGDDPFYGGVTVTCTVAAGLADNRGNEMDEDFVWTFTTEDIPRVAPATWGTIKAGF